MGVGLSVCAQLPSRAWGISLAQVTQLECRLPRRPQGEEEGRPLWCHPAASNLLSSWPKLWRFFQLPVPPAGGLPWREEEQLTPGGFRLKVVLATAEEEVGPASRLAKQNCHEENYEVN